jgi:hypothetical protein
MAVDLLKKQKRKELFSTVGEDDTDDELVLAQRWATALIPPTQSDDTCAVNTINTGRSIAIWYPKHRVAVVVSLKGKYMHTFGVTGDGEFCLLPEEALFLVEKRHLTLYHGGEDTVLTSYSEAKLLSTKFISPNTISHAEKEECTQISSKDCLDGGGGGGGGGGGYDHNAGISLRCLSTNIEDVYSALLSRKTGVSLGCYMAYRSIRDQLLMIARRHSRYLGNGSSCPNRIHITKHIPDVPVYRPNMPFDESMVIYETFPT